MMDDIQLIHGEKPFWLSEISSHSDLEVICSDKVTFMVSKVVLASVSHLLRSLLSDPKVGDGKVLQLILDVRSDQFRCIWEMVTTGLSSMTETEFCEEIADILAYLDISLMNVGPVSDEFDGDPMQEDPTEHFDSDVDDDGNGNSLPEEDEDFVVNQVNN